MFIIQNIKQSGEVQLYDGDTTSTFSGGYSFETDIVFISIFYSDSSTFSEHCYDTSSRNVLILILLIHTSDCS